MSDHALLSEVRANLPIHLAVKAADVLWSKDHLTYTNLPTEVVHHRGGHGGNRRRRTSTLRSDHQPHGHALDEAKRIVDDALKKSNTKSSGNHGKGSRNSRNRRSTSGEGDLTALRSKVDWLVKENEDLRSKVLEIHELVQKLTGTSVSEKPKASEKKVEVKEEKKDEDFDLFGSESENDEEKERIKEERLKAYAEKKAKKPGPIAKSSVILDVKPWDDETDLKEMEKLVKSIEQDGLVWGASKLIPIGYGINKLQVVMTIEDEKVSVDDLIEKITSDFEDHVQSCDIVAFNKI